MTFKVDTKRVVGVLLSDAWHVVEAGSFTVGQAEYTRAGKALLPGGGRFATPAGFSLTERGVAGGLVTICGPLSAILALKLKAEGTHDRA